MGVFVCAPIPEPGLYRTQEIMRAVLDVLPPLLSPFAQSFWVLARALFFFARPDSGLVIPELARRRSLALTRQSL